MSGEKPAPTAAEVDAAREMLHRYAHNIDPPLGGQWVRTLLAALDAAEARAETAEKSLDIVRARWVEADRRANDNAERAENMRAEWVPWTKKLATAERERDELSDALKLYEAFPELATGDTARRDEQRAAYNGLRWVLGLLAGLDDGRQDSVAKAFRPVVEKIKRERDEARAALVAIQERRFPIMHGPSIRWSVLAPHEKQAMRNHSQTLAQLADRGGLDPIEAMAVYEDHEYPRGMCGDQATAMRAAWRALVDRTDAQAKEAPRG